MAVRSEAPAKDLADRQHARPEDLGGRRATLTAERAQREECERDQANRHDGAILGSARETTKKNGTKAYRIRLGRCFWGTDPRRRLPAARPSFCYPGA